MTKINLDELIADREAGTDGPWEASIGGEVRIEPIAGKVFRINQKSEADARRIARLPDLEAAYLEAVADITRLRERLLPEEMTKEDYEAIYGWGGQG